MTQPVSKDDILRKSATASASGSRRTITSLARMTRPATVKTKVEDSELTLASGQPVGLDQPNGSGVSPVTEDAATDLVPSVELIAETVRAIVGDQNYSHWFQRRTRMRSAGDRLQVHVPNPFILNWLLKRFRTQLTKAAQVLLGPSATCQLEVDASLLLDEGASDSRSPLSGDAFDNGSSRAADPGSDLQPVADRHLSAQSNSTLNQEAANPFAQVKRGVAPSPIPGGTSGRRKFRTFDSFVAGDSNNLAVMASRQVATAPGERFNPLYIFGGTGTGKTHLLEAIYADVKKRRPNSQVMYLSTEAFTNYFTSALASRTVPSFRQRFRNVDILLIDNVEFLDNKRATQEEFLHTIVQVTEHGGQVVVSSDRHPRMLTKHREELTTRFMGGLVCRIENPDEATSLAIARSVAATLKAKFSDEVLEYVARRCRRNIREIQGALNSLDGQFTLTGRRISLHVAREVLGELTQDCHRLIRISDVERIVCEAFGVSAADLRSPTRRKAISLPRSIAMFIARKMTGTAYREIGLYFGGRDHSTVVAAERRIAELVASEAAVTLPSSCPGRTYSDIIHELQNRLLSAAS